MHSNTDNMRVHFIAIGGSAMHNLAIALKSNGANVSGSDDEIFEPSASRLKKHKLLPKSIGWFPEKINKKIDAVILGMHARLDNPELIEAQKQNLKIYSYPEFLYERTKNKKRIVIGGSHGKTTVTSMIMHVLKENNISFDYMVGANIKGFDTMVNIQKNNKIAVFEGDEYLSSPIDLRPKFHLYKPHIAVITGIAWDHINVFPSFEMYLSQFDTFIKTIENDGELFYYKNDENILSLISNNPDVIATGYSEVKHNTNNDGTTTIKHENHNYKLNVFGKHNMQNLQAALLICKRLGVGKVDFLNSIKSFKGASKRMQLIKKGARTDIYLDFAHAPSKVKATVSALKEKKSNRELVACLELHTYSSLKKEFLPEYLNSMQKADQAIIYYSPAVLKHKKLDDINPDYVKKCFGENSIVFTCSQKMQDYLKSILWDNKNLLFMSSGNFNGINFAEFANELS